MKDSILSFSLIICGLIVMLIATLVKIKQQENEIVFQENSINNLRDEVEVFEFRELMFIDSIKQFSENTSYTVVMDILTILNESKALIKFKEKPKED